MKVQNVNAFVPILPGLPSDAPKAKERQVLFSCGGVVEPGEMMALMGPSGSGVWVPGCRCAGWVLAGRAATREYAFTRVYSWTAWSHTTTSHPNAAQPRSVLHNVLP